MTKLLEKAISRGRELPEDRQDELAEMLLDCADQPEVILTPEQMSELELSIKEADEGKFATEEEVAALWKRFGL